MEKSSFSAPFLSCCAGEEAREVKPSRALTFSALLRPLLNTPLSFGLRAGVSATTLPDHAVSVSAVSQPVSSPGPQRCQTVTTPFVITPRGCYSNRGGGEPPPFAPVCIYAPPFAGMEDMADLMRRTHPPRTNAARGRSCQGLAVMPRYEH